MRALALSLYLILPLSLVLSFTVSLSRGNPRIRSPVEGDDNRRILPQPLFPLETTPPQAGQPPPESPETPGQLFFPEVPNGVSPYQTQITPPSNVSSPFAPGTAAQPTSPTKKVAIAIFVGIVTLGMLSAFAFFLYRHRVRHPHESQKLVSGGVENNSQRFAQEPTEPASDLLYLGTIEPLDHREGGVGAGEEINGIDSPYHKLSSIRMLELHRPSPELHPLPPLNRVPPRRASPPPAMSSDEETFYYTPQDVRSILENHK